MPSQHGPPGQPTHSVENQPPPLEALNLYESDRTLKAAVAREGAGWAAARLGAFGALVGSAQVQALGHAANRNPPELRTHDRFGNRVDQVDFHPAWHELMAIGMEAEIHALPWNRPEAGSHVARAAADLRGDLSGTATGDTGAARRLVERLAVALQASLMVRHAAPEAADRFCAARLHGGGGGGALYGTLAPGPALRTIVEAARPQS